MSSSLLFHASPSFLYVTLCPTTLMLFALRRTSGPSSRFTSVKTTDFYATLMFGVFMTLAGIFGLVAESLGSAGSRWWFSAAYAMQTLAILIAQLAVIQLLTPDYLFGLLSITTSSDGVPSWRIYALIFTSILASVSSLISVFVVYQTPSLPSSLPVLVSICIPLPLLFSLAGIVKSARLKALSEVQATITYTSRGSKCIELGPTSDGDPLPVTLRFPRVWELAATLQSIAALAALAEVIEGGLGRRVPALSLLTSVGLVVWGGGIMTIHFVIIYEPMHRSAMAPAIEANIRRVADQPSEDFMTLKDPFASPTQVGFPLPPSPQAPRRKPRRRASEPLQLTRFGSFARATEDIKEKQAGTEADQDTSLEALVRHALFSTGGGGSDSTRNNSHTASGSSRTTFNELDVFTHSPGMPFNASEAVCTSGCSTPTIKRESSFASEATSMPVLSWHPFCPPTPPRPVHALSRASQCALAFPEPPSSFPLSSSSYETSACSLPLNLSTPPSAYKAPPSPCSSDSGSSFVSPPPTPTPDPSRQLSQRNARSLALALPALASSSVPARRRGSGSPGADWWGQ